MGDFDKDKTNGVMEAYLKMQGKKPESIKEEVSQETDMSVYTSAIKQTVKKDEIKESITQTPATIADVQSAISASMANIQKSLSSLGGGGIGEQDAIRIAQQYGGAAGSAQELSLNTSTNELSITNGNSVDFTPILGGDYGDSDVATFLNGNLNTNIIPDTNAAYDIGSAEFKIRHLYLSDNSLYFVDNSNVEYPLNIQGGNLFFNGEQVSVGAGGGSYSDADVDAHLNTGVAATNQVLSWTGADYAWVAQSGGSGGSSGVVYLTDYGAVGGDSALDTAAWDTALDALVLAGGGTLVIPKNAQRYIIAPITPADNCPQLRDYSNITIRAEAGGKILAAGTYGGLINMETGTSNFTIANLDILIPAAAGNGGFDKACIMTRRGGIDNVTIRDCIIKNEQKPDTDGAPWFITFWEDVVNGDADTSDVTNITIENCELEQWGRAGYGIHFLRRSQFSKVLNNRITLHANTDGNNQAFNAIAMYGHASEFQIIGNTVFKSGHSAIAASMARNGIIKENYCFGTINTVEGGIEVETKVSHAPVGETDPVENVIVTGNYVEGCSFGIMVTNRNAVDTAGSYAPRGITISDNTVINSIESDIVVYDILSGTSLTTEVPEDITIINNTCRSTAVDGGIRVYNCNNVNILANTVEGMSTGIHVGRNSTISVRGSVNILGNLVTDTDNQGILIESVDGTLRCSNNSIILPGNNGIQMITAIAGSQQYEGNYVEGSVVGAGFSVRNGRTITLGSIFKNNRAFNNFGRGFDVRLDDSIMRDNIAKGNGVTNDFRTLGTGIIQDNIQLP